MNFDPLHQSTATTSVTKTTPPSVKTVTTSRTSPSIVTRQKYHAMPSAVNPVLERGVTIDSPTMHRNSTFHASDDINPFLTPSAAESHKRMKHGASDTNLHRLQAEVQYVSTMGSVNFYMTRSEEDLTGTGSSNEVGYPRHCVAPPTGNGMINGGSTMKGGKHSGSTEDLNGDKEDKLSKSLFFVTLSDSDLASDIPSSSKSVRRNEQPRNFSASMNVVDQQHHSQNNETSNRTSPSMSKRHRLEFLNPSGIKPMTSRVNMRSPEFYRKKGLSRGRDRSKSAAVPTHRGKSQWVSRYRPGVPVPIPGGTARESIMQSELRHREKEFCSSIKTR